MEIRMKRRDLFQQKPIYIVLAFAVVLTILCIVRMAMPNRAYQYMGSHTFTTGVPEEISIMKGISLPVGVYEVELVYDTDTNMKNVCYMADGTVFNGGLLTNGENLHANLGRTSFAMWLFEGTTSMELIVAYGGEGKLVTGDLFLYETDSLWTMLLTIIWGITLLVVAVLTFRCYDRQIGVDKEKKTVLLGLLVIILAASLPYLQRGGIGGADWIYHLHRIEGVRDGIVSGQFPVRLEPEWLFGHGYANAVFYCNTLLYIPAFFRLVGFTVITSYNLYCICLNIATAFIAYYCFKNIFNSRYIGLLCSGLYTLSVFRIYKLVITCAVGEASAVTFMPLVLYGLYRAFTEDAESKTYKTVWIPIAAGYAGLIQTHVLSCEITAFLTIIVCLVCLKKVFVKETFLQLAKGALAALLMSFWYLVPFLDYYLNENMHIRHVSGRTIQERGLYIPQLFLQWWTKGGNALVVAEKGMVSSDPMGGSLLLGGALLLFFILWFAGVWKQEKNRVVVLGKTAGLLAAVLMVMSLNIFPWDKLQKMNGMAASLISSIQFPNRFLGWGTVFLVTVTGCLLWFFGKNKHKWYYYLCVICVIAGICTSNIYLLDHTCRDSNYITLYNEEGMGFGYISGAEYVVEGTDFLHMDYAVPVSSDNVEITHYEKEYLHVWMNCLNGSNREGYVDLPMLHYTGYRAYGMASGQEYQTMKGNNNVVRVLIPAGTKETIEVKFVSPIHWRLSEAITYVWWVVICVLLIKNFRNRRKTA